MDDAPYFCHNCNSTISPVLPDYTCPQCNGGFIERVEGEDSPMDDYSTFELPPLDDNVGPSVLDALSSLLGRDSLSRSQSRTRTTNGDRSPSTDSANPTSAAASAVDSSEDGAGGGVRVGARFPGFEMTVRSGGSGVDVRWLQDLMSIVLGPGMSNDGGGGIPILFNLPSGNLGDYAWGQDGLDNVVTQLLNQLEGQGGVPPLTQDEIANVKTVEVTESMLEKNSQCSVCMDDFKVGEQVRGLVCDHFFHEACIVPWLERHGTCPVCRKELSSRQLGAAVGGGPSVSATPRAAGSDETPSGAGRSGTQASAAHPVGRTQVTVELGGDPWEQVIDDVLAEFGEPEVD
jgi:E3 ubiquitin-protein ligase RNF115/126